ncbi:hypothetical protein F53441_13850 [Fusarium austroafricanum]|uniref:Nephrocystin 3-like N-terminal domain-containing protein n=1 Tax=Fusarium austroafricanum TaxID=2364996 RepID=A0A8H4JKC0_9HYPO|nr:hypothetical protein F53441_13850 [Fusarium austroafricanum]
MRQSTIFSLALSLCTAVQASNPVLGGYVSGACDSCLDNVYEMCPGDYKTRPYATCMCAGDGSAAFVSCMSQCDPGLNEPANAVTTWYTYCVMFFKDLCDGAQEYLDAEKYNEECSKKAIAAGGIGEKKGEDGDDGSEEPEKPEANETKGSSPKETGDSASKDEANNSETTKTSDSAKTTSTSGAMATVAQGCPKMHFNLLDRSNMHAQPRWLSNFANKADHSALRKEYPESMADPFSIAASIAGIISLTDTVFGYVFRYGRAATGAKEDVRRLGDEINSFSGVLRSLHALACDFETQGQEFESTLRVEHLSQCERTFEMIGKRVKKALDDFNKPSKLHTLSRQLKWPYSTSETKELLADVEHQDKSNHDLEKTFAQAKISAQILLDNQKKRILDFFMTPDGNPQRNLDQSIKWRQPTTGTWLLESKELKDWLATSGSRLWLKGIPGGGKTILAGAVIQEILAKSVAGTNSTGVAFYFCDYKDSKTHCPIKILGAVAHQLALQKDDAFAYLENYYHDLHPERALNKTPDVDELRATITRMSKTFDQVFIIIDGIDECGGEVQNVARALAELADSTDTASIAIFSRDEEEIRTALNDDFKQVKISARREDVATYIKAEMELRERRGQPIVRDATVKKVELKLIERAQGMFRWVVCQINYMGELWTDIDCLEALGTLPRTLHESYYRILERLNKLPAKTRRSVQLCLKLLAFFPVRLSIPDLCQAVSMPEELGARMDHIVDEHLIMRTCSSLIWKTTTGEYFEFAHFTVQEFLEDEALLSLPNFAPYRICRELDEPDLGLLCLKFIQLRNFDGDITDLEQILSEHVKSLSFYEIAATQWPQLTANCFAKSGSLEAAKALFRPKNTVFLVWSSVFIYQTTFWTKPPEPGEGVIGVAEMAQRTLFEGLRPIHMAATLNIPEICSFLIQ